MKPRPTMTDEQVARWEATITGSKLIDKQAGMARTIVLTRLGWKAWAWLRLSRRAK